MEPVHSERIGPWTSHCTKEPSVSPWRDFNQTFVQKPDHNILIWLPRTCRLTPTNLQHFCCGTSQSSLVHCCCYLSTYSFNITAVFTLVLQQFFQQKRILCFYSFMMFNSPSSWFYTGGLILWLLVTGNACASSTLTGWTLQNPLNKQPLRWERILWLPASSFPPEVSFSYLFLTSVISNKAAWASFLLRFILEK